MPSPAASNVLTDASTIPIPQFFDNTGGGTGFVALYGDPTLHEFFVRQAPIPSPSVSNGYVAGFQAKASGGTYFGCYGQYKSTVAEAWIMLFDINGVPAVSAQPTLGATAVGPKTSGQGDVNWFIAPNKPYIFTNGLYIALSLTGGVFTPSGAADMVVWAELL